MKLKNIIASIVFLTGTTFFSCENPELSGEIEMPLSLTSETETRLYFISGVIAVRGGGYADGKNFTEWDIFRGMW
jgi:hypothetical protein